MFIIIIIVVVVVIVLIIECGCLWLTLSPINLFIVYLFLLIKNNVHII